MTSASMTSRLSPVQAGLRFGLEIAALVAWAMAAWRAMPSTPASAIAAAVVVVAAGAAWGTFRVPGDASASGEAPVAVSGRTRLFVELAMLLGAAVVSIATGRPVFGAILGALVLFHYATTLPRIRWLLAQ